MKENALYSYYQSMNREGVVLYFNGPISQSVVESIGEMMRRKMACEEEGMQTARKVFAVLVEQMQNIINYSVDACRSEAEGNLGMGQIMVGRREEGFFVSCGNAVDREMEARIRGMIDAVNGMDREELKAYYRRQRRAEPDEMSRGAGLGFIEMARKASRPLDYRFTPIDASTSFLAVTVSI